MASREEDVADVKGNLKVIVGIPKSDNTANVNIIARRCMYSRFALDSLKESEL